MGGSRPAPVSSLHLLCLPREPRAAVLGECPMPCAHVAAARRELVTGFPPEGPWPIPGAALGAWPMRSAPLRSLGDRLVWQLLHVGLFVEMARPPCHRRLQPGDCHSRRMPPEGRPASMWPRVPIFNSPSVTQGGPCCMAVPSPLACRTHGAWELSVPDVCHWKRL